MTVKGFCAPRAVLHRAKIVHHAYMVKRPAKQQKVVSRLRPLYQRTFIKQWREYRELSQQELADKVGEYLAERGIRERGYTHASIGRLENGKMPYKQPVMEAIADALEVTVEILVSRPPPKLPGEADPDTEFRVMWNKADDDEKGMYLDILKTIRRKTGTGI